MEVGMQRACLHQYALKRHRLQRLAQGLEFATGTGDLVARPRILRVKPLELFQDRICSRSPAERS